MVAAADAAPRDVKDDNLQRTRPLQQTAVHLDRVAHDVACERRTVRALPRQQRSIDLVNSFIDAARDGILLRGVNGVTLKRVTHIVGVTASTIYRYFPDNVSLIDAVVARDLERLEALFAARLCVDHIRSAQHVVREAVRAMVELHLSATGSTSLATNMTRMKPGHDHVSQFAASVWSRVVQEGQSPAGDVSLRQCVNLIALMDAVLLNASHPATRTWRETRLRTCEELLGVVVGQISGSKLI
ncbi:TetR/AcrR family transcriptional regulator [Agreia sp. PsM10]|uniref:TetR/AcrR family transcriptional regulator n=1 Tax=Agreia sp. PsM10 TaxID=3030533 RepID=UPI00345E3D6F